MDLVASHRPRMEGFPESSKHLRSITLKPFSISLLRSGGSKSLMPARLSQSGTDICPSANSPSRACTFFVGWRGSHQKCSSLFTNFYKSLSLPANSGTRNLEMWFQSFSNWMSSIIFSVSPSIQASKAWFKVLP